ncbi:cytochrome C oxidase subunit IV family protein [Actinomycetospora sp. TBRC 11914]|uniref:cytochrome C oxidase subunit IV family protein n=1 Tax=Actinomycetospora sp. TBRC 11914 TaxID=2729387 RepID=UPI00145F248F|nr:cytochrome C oxidase subunit IV family protein [Actinomycetospora sp. TBRC 11914]NMO91676.1 hypothetical protein [Actinomycetospora sp. TBRC 11914]
MTPVHIRVPRDVLAVWAILVVITLVAFGIGGEAVTGRGLASVVLALTFAKVGLVGASFMEVHRSAAILRGLFLGWLVVTAGLLIVLVHLGF